MATLDDKDFKRYLEEAIGQDNAQIAFSAFTTDPSVSVRLNPFKPGASFQGETKPVTWSKFGLMLDSRPSFTLDPLFHAGAYYVQDSSAMFVGDIFRKVLSGIYSTRTIKVLDLCAAPGGKTTDLAASLRMSFGEGFLLVANEVMRQRASVLCENVAIWGDPNVVVTSVDPKAFASLSGFFDIILADVPCSGEGMFRKDAEALAEWSKETVALCESRQRRIIADVWPALRSDGILIYSTCTFNKYENDGNVAWIADNLGASHVSQSEFGDYGTSVLDTEFGFSLVPGLVEGEGQYCSVLRKNDGGDHFCHYGSRGKSISNEAVAPFFKIKVMPRVKGDLLIAVPEQIGSLIEVIESLHPLRVGVRVGTLEGKSLVPDADLALTFSADDKVFPTAELDLNSALSFLHRDTIVLPDSPKGFLKVSYKGNPLGFVKNLGNRCNNLQSKERRIRMNIN